MLVENLTSWLNLCWTRQNFTPLDMCSTRLLGAACGHMADASARARLHVKPTDERLTLSVK
jgi:hypothetical protein